MRKSSETGSGWPGAKSSDIQRGTPLIFGRIWTVFETVVFFRFLDSMARFGRSAAKFVIHEWGSPRSQKSVLVWQVHAEIFRNGFRSAVQPSEV